MFGKLLTWNDEGKSLVAVRLLEASKQESLIEPFYYEVLEGPMTGMVVQIPAGEVYCGETTFSSKPHGRMVRDMRRAGKAIRKHYGSEENLSESKGKKRKVKK